MMIEINRNPSVREIRIFAILQLAFFALIALWLDRHWPDSILPTAVVSFSAVMLVAGLIHAPAIRWFLVGWMYAVFPIGWTVFHLLMAVTFYGLLTPLGLLARLCGHDALQLKAEPDAETYWQARGESRPRTDYFRQY